MFTSSFQLQNRSFHDDDRKSATAKCTIENEIDSGIGNLSKHDVDESEDVI